ncbi:uncharacterized protein MONOS_17672 [Monocercomonoides exilis]|uniref:uncharacterized protein n=1 Tax=Monocercomonoides exilis TaxID=2049356 RepID=UPI00355A0552|nr:hypothetical protein MONOS_17672 [Monocercomonoides exilis]
MTIVHSDSESQNIRVERAFRCITPERMDEEEEDDDDDKDEEEEEETWKRQNDERLKFGRENTEDRFQTFSRGCKKNWRSRHKEEDSTEAKKKENVKRTNNEEGEDAAYFVHA